MVISSSFGAILDFMYGFAMATFIYLVVYLFETREKKRKEKEAKSPWKRTRY